MKRYSTDVNCRGCLEPMTVTFNAPLWFKQKTVRDICPKCDSVLAIDLRHGDTTKTVMTRVRMLEHTQKLLEILNERANAADHA